ncbi:MAG: hypothetical protein ACHP79_09090 [Terriglobales bacterium]
MATAKAMLERRRASRVLIRIPVKLFSKGAFGTPLDTPAEAIAVSRYGALLRAPYSPDLGSRIEVLNGLSQETQEFRVIRISDAKEDGQYELGIETLYPTNNFWGIQFPDERRV